jgi:hypothetical protein
MSPKQRRITGLVGLFLIFAVTHVYVGVSYAEPGPPNKTVSVAAPAAPAPPAILNICHNKRVTVNGASVASGATVLTTSTIETGDRVTAKVTFGPLGILEIAPNTKERLDFDQNGVKVTLIDGCVILKTKKNWSGEVITEQTPPARSDTSKGTLNAKVAAGVLATGAAAACAVGCGTAAVALIPAATAAGAAAAAVIPHGTNPSPSAP